MIYLITGNMGTGKTAKVVNMILSNEDGLFKMTVADGTVIDRPLYYSHIDGFKAGKFNAHELTREQIQSEPLDKILPTGAVLIIDEAHWTYPVRSAASKVPEYIQKLSELRHDGFTLILMTQHPSQLDIFVRNLVSKHYHLERKSIGMKQYWWYKCVTNLDNPAAIVGTESSQWTPPEEAFDYYKSSSHHQKFVKKIPPALYILIAILAFVAWKLFGMYQIYDKNVNPVDNNEVVAASQAVPDHYLKNNLELGSNYQNNLTANMFVPSLADKPESKPLYDNVRQVKTFERVAGCVSGGKSGCTCYSHQGTSLQEISKDLCLKYVNDGLPFDPYKDEQRVDLNQLDLSSHQLNINEHNNQAQVPQIYALSGDDKVPKTEPYPDRLKNIQ